MTLLWGTHPIVMPFGATPEESVKKAEEILLQQGLVKEGNHLVILSYIVEGNENFDSIKLRKI